MHQPKRLVFLKKGGYVPKTKYMLVVLMIIGSILGYLMSQVIAPLPIRKEYVVGKIMLTRSVAFAHEK